MNEKIVLINPNYDYSASKMKDLPIYNRIWPPLSLANCAALLEREGFYVEIIDANAERLSTEQVANRVIGFDKIFVTSSSIDRWQCPHLSLDPFLKLVKKIREDEEVELYVMGSHGTVRPKEILNMTKANAIILGEPELTVLDICNNGLKNTEGLCYKKGNKLILNQRKNFLDLNNLPIPAFHLLPMKKYFYEVLGRNFTLFEASRGCPFDCIFCLKKMYGRYRRKSVKKLIQEIKYAIEEFGVKSAYFIDLEFTTNRDLVEKLCDFLIEKKYDFEWCCQTRADSVDLELLKRMKSAGCKLIHYGVETGSGRIMKLINKKITLERIKKGVELTKKVGIDTACFFLFGFPTETLEDMKKTINFAKELNPTYTSFHIAAPYPGTQFFEIVKEDLIELFPMAYTQSYSFNGLKKMTKTAFLQFYFRPSVMLSVLLGKNMKLITKELKLFLSYIMREKI